MSESGWITQRVRLPVDLGRELGGDRRSVGQHHCPPSSRSDFRDEMNLIAGVAASSATSAAASASLAEVLIIADLGTTDGQTRTLVEAGQSSQTGRALVRQAAHLLGVHPSLIPKMLRRGDLGARRERPSLSRAGVLELAAVRAAAAAAAAEARRAVKPSGPVPPHDVHDWLVADEAGAVMGVGPEAVKVRARRGRLPSVVHDRRRWFRSDHLELVKHADDVKRGSIPWLTHISTMAQPSGSRAVKAMRPS